MKVIPYLEKETLVESALNKFLTMKNKSLFRYISLILLVLVLIQTTSEIYAQSCEGDSCVRVSFYTGYKCVIVNYLCPEGMSIVATCTNRVPSSGIVVGNCIVNWDPPAE
jgi:hypothetical protein